MKIPFTFWFGYAFIFWLAPVFSAAAQGTITIDFAGYADNTPLGEQFANQGVHFVAEQAFISSSFDGPTSKIGVTRQDRFGLRFDPGISSFSLSVSIYPQSSSELGALSLAMSGITGSGLGWNASIPEPNSNWRNTGVFVPPRPDTREIWFQSANIMADGNHGGFMYFSAITVTTVPEPTTTALLLAGLAVILKRRCRTMSYTAAPFVGRRFLGRAETGTFTAAT